jgi:hypothetical protein
VHPKQHNKITANSRKLDFPAIRLNTLKKTRSKEWFTHK